MSHKAFLNLTCPGWILPADRESRMGGQAENVDPASDSKIEGLDGFLSKVHLRGSGLRSGGLVDYNSLIFPFLAPRDVGG